jgi:hypothetical protein
MNCASNPTLERSSVVDQDRLGDADWDTLIRLAFEARAPVQTETRASLERRHQTAIGI